MVRYRGDSYPFEAIIKMNGIVVDLTDATVTFSYKEKSTVRKIAGVITSAVEGKVEFVPTATDFQVSGTYQYDIQRSQNGFVYTHGRGTIQILDDINKD